MSNIHDTETSFEDIPNLFYKSIAKEKGNASFKHALSSVYLIPDNYSNLKKSKINFSVIFTPLAELSEEDS